MVKLFIISHLIVFGSAGKSGLRTKVLNPSNLMEEQDSTLIMEDDLDFQDDNLVLANKRPGSRDDKIGGLDEIPKQNMEADKNTSSSNMPQK